MLEAGRFSGSPKPPPPASWSETTAPGARSSRAFGATGFPSTKRVRTAPSRPLDATFFGSRTSLPARGFNGGYSNKLLVLVDGRTVYLSSIAGVRWNVQQTPVEDIERIEVVRGPGATLYGANAVNGVIDIITKHAVDSLAGRVGHFGFVSTISVYSDSATPNQRVE